MNFLTRLIKRIRNYFNPNSLVEDRLFQTDDKVYKRPAVTNTENGIDTFMYKHPTVLMKPPIVEKQKHTPITTAAPRMRSVGRGTMVKDRDSSVTVSNSYAVNHSPGVSPSEVLVTAVVADTILNTYTPEPNYESPSCSSDTGGD